MHRLLIPTQNNKFQPKYEKNLCQNYIAIQCAHEPLLQIDGIGYHLAEGFHNHSLRFLFLGGDGQWRSAGSHYRPYV